jgi:uncharacterized membrane protein YjjP (DUF1212 family)
MAVLGHQLRQFKVDVQNRRDMGAHEGLQTPNRTRAIMQVIVSIAVLAAALYVLLAGGYSETVEKFMTGLIGTVLGYWLH